MKIKKKQIAVLVGSLIGAVTGNTAWAQNASTANTGALEEIIITAQKVQENLQKVPLSVTAMNSAELERKGISNIADLLSVRLPSVSLAPFAGRTDTLNMTMRGAANSDPTQGTTDAAVAILVDDVYNARGTGVNFGVAEMQRMEVLRGPQGTLFGRNALGGAIRIVTRQPTGELGGNVKLNFGNFGYNSQEAHINAPEMNGLSMKIDIKQEKRDGFVKNASTNSALAAHRDFGALDNQGGKFTAKFIASDKLQFNYSYDDATLKQTTGYTQHAVTPSSCQSGPCVGASLLVAMPRSNVGDYPDTSWIGMYNDWAVTKATNHRLGIEYAINDKLTFKSITTDSKTDSLVRVTLNGAYSFTSFGGANLTQLPASAGGPFNTPAAYGSNGIAAGGLTGPNQIFGLAGVIPFSDVISKSKSQEFQLIGNTDNTKWVTGAYWYKEDSVDSRQTAFSLAYTGFAGGIPINPVATNPFSLVAGGGSQDTSATLTQSYVKAYAGFGQLTWTPADMQQLHVTGGLRYSHENRTFHRSIDAGRAVSIDQPTFNLGRLDSTLSAAFDLSSVTNVYARYGSAYRAGGASVRAPWVGAFSNLAVYKEEVHKSVEAGIKSDLLDRRLRLNAAAFLTSMENVIQAVQLNPVNPSITGTINLPGKQKVKGVELEAIFAATDHLQFSGNFTVQSYTQASDVQTYIDATDAGAVYQIAPFPKQSGQIAADYTLPVAMGAVAFHIDWAKSSKSPGTPRVAKGNYNIPVWTNVANARVTWQGINVGPATLKLAAYVRNLTNVHVPAFSATSGQWNASDPRTYGIDMSADF